MIMSFVISASLIEINKQRDRRKASLKQATDHRCVSAGYKVVLSWLIDLLCLQNKDNSRVPGSCRNVRLTAVCMQDNHPCL
jgi:hypothetical protein